MNAVLGILVCLAAMAAAAPQGYNYNSNTRGYLPPAPPAAVVTKHIYVHSAPEEEDEGPSEPINLGPPHKHYRVIFIKAPVQPNKKLNVIPPQNEEKTLIYVLSKKPDESDIQINAQVHPTEPSKPEVFFIKYRTQEEALHAQHQIQAQYDALGGSTQVSDEGIAPVQSVIGSLGHKGSSTSSLSGHSHSVFSSHGYLPPQK